MIPTVHVACRGGGMEVKFQSRNREAYDSNSPALQPARLTPTRFNLVIEKLMIPTLCPVASQTLSHSSFNLVIEKLMIPTTLRMVTAHYILFSFNLVIEKLMIPTQRFELCYSYTVRVSIS